MTTPLTDTQKRTIRSALAKWEGLEPTDDGNALLWHADSEEWTCEDLPNYTTSLDASHSIEVKLTDEEHKHFVHHLGALTATIPSRNFYSPKAWMRSLALFRSLNLGELGD